MTTKSFNFRWFDDSSKQHIITSHCICSGNRRGGCLIGTLPPVWILCFTKYVRPTTSSDVEKKLVYLKTRFLALALSWLLVHISYRSPMCSIPCPWIFVSFHHGYNFFNWWETPYYCSWINSLNIWRKIDNSDRNNFLTSHQSLCNHPSVRAKIPLCRLYGRCLRWELLSVLDAYFLLDYNLCPRW